MAHYMDGASYTVGPTQNISIRMSSMLRNFGGEALCDATVDRIIIEKGRAVGVMVRNTSSGKDGPLTEIRARNIVCATSTFNLHNKLLPGDHPSVKDFFNTDKRTITEVSVFISITLFYSELFIVSLLVTCSLKNCYFPLFFNRAMATYSCFARSRVKRMSCSCPSIIFGISIHMIWMKVR